VRCRKPLLTAALVALVAVAAAPAATSSPPSGEKIYAKPVLIPLYNGVSAKPKLMH